MPRSKTVTPTIFSHSTLVSSWLSPSRSTTWAISPSFSVISFYSYCCMLLRLEILELSRQSWHVQNHQWPSPLFFENEKIDWGEGGETKPKYSFCQLCFSVIPSSKPAVISSFFNVKRDQNSCKKVSLMKTKTLILPMMSVLVLPSSNTEVTSTFSYKKY